AARTAVDPEAAAQDPGPFPHPQDAVAAFGPATGIEPDPVVAKREDNLPAGRPEGDLDQGRMGVLPDVRQRFLGNAKELTLDAQREGRLDLGLNMDAQPGV